MKLLWLDLETTGLMPNSDDILEIAAAVAHLEHPFCTSGIHQWVLHHDGPQAKMSDWVIQTHQKTGLWKACKESPYSLGRIEHELLKLVDLNADPKEKTTLAGSSVHFDLSFIRAHMPTLAKHLHYRVFDVSTLKLFARAMGMPKIEPKEAHRAALDVIESMDHAKQCRDWLRKGAY